MIIREFSLNDVHDVTPLMEQLGYPTTFDKLYKRLSSIQSFANYQTLVAEQNGNVVGMIGFSLQYFYEYDGTFAQVGVFIVDKGFRRRGIGKELLVEAEKWAKRQGVLKVLINSGNREERQGSHQFYAQMGYHAKSVGFLKDIGD